MAAPRAGSRAEQWLQFAGAAASIAGFAIALAAFTAAIVDSNDGRIKALLLWCYGITAAGAFVVYQVLRREHKDKRFARSLTSTHLAHHKLRDAAYERYIARRPADLQPIIEDSLREFAAAFSVAISASCHATIKTLSDPNGGPGRDVASPNDFVIKDYARSSPRPPRPKAGIPANTVGRNSDFRSLFSTDADNRCWFHNDLLSLEPGVYDNPHWPENPNHRNVPYRATMVWPIRKVLREGTTTAPTELYIHGFLTVDSPQPNVLEYERHFDLGAAYADHLMSVLWNPDQVRKVYRELFGAAPS